MLLKAYALIWILLAVVAGMFFLAGYTSHLTLTVFGFFVSALFFMGIIAILPWWVDKHHSPKY